MAQESAKVTPRSTSTPTVYCANCGTPFAPPTSQASKIYDDEYQDFLFDPKTKTSLLIATVYLPRCPNCTLDMIEAVKRAKPKKSVPVLKFDKSAKSGKSTPKPIENK